MKRAAGREAILVVDDEADVVSSLGRVLKVHGYEVESAGSIAAALDRDDWDRFLAVILDRKLPDGMVDDFLAQFRERDAEMAIIIATGYADLEGTIAALKHRVEDYLIKPVGPENLLSRLGKIAGMRASQERERRLELEVVNAVEGEKERISMDLHDGIGSKLSAIQMDCRRLEDLLRRAGQSDAADHAQRIDRHLKETIGDVRGLSRELSPVYSDPSGLEGALRQLASRIHRCGEVECLFVGPEDLKFEDSIGANHLFRIAQEAVSNAIRHGAPSRVTIEVVESEGELVLRVVDDGRGFDLSAVKGTARGLGLHTMEYRARALGGSLTIQPGVKGGTEVVFRAPRASA
jgi:signal transduction histidine kinase